MVAVSFPRIPTAGAAGRHAFRSLACLPAVLVAVMVAAPGAFAYDTSGYKSRLAATLAEIGTGSLADPKATLARLDEMITLGIVGVREYGAKQPRYAKLMDAVIADASAMKAMTDSEIEDKWGEKGIGGDAVGVPLASLGQHEEVRAYIELVIGPAHAYILVKNWASTKKAKWLEQSKDELTELVEHQQRAP